MDNPYVTGVAEKYSAQMDYAAIKLMLEEVTGYRYTQNLIVPRDLLKVIEAELKYWHDYALELEKDHG